MTAAGQPPAADFEPAGPVELLDLLAAILEAVDIPLPATAGDESAYRKVLAARVIPVRAVLASLLAEPRIVRAAGDAKWRAGFIREQVATLPTDDYRHYHPDGSAS